MEKRFLSERDICSKFIMPALIAAGWDLKTQISEEKTLTDGRIIVRGKMVARGQKKRADYVLYLKPNIPIAIIEAKDNKHSINDGMQQALTYAGMLRVPFAFSSNGDGFVFHDRTGQSSEIETRIGLDDFPSPATLLAKYKAWKGFTDIQAESALFPYYDDGRTPRYYQMNAINASLEAISKGQDRLLLVMATGTGKTLTAFQIIWRLWKSGAKKRVLFLADRNILIDQTMVNDFRPFIGDMAKLSSHSKTIERPDGSTEQLTLAVDKKRRINTAYQIYLGLYQALTGPKESQKIFKELSPDFFDLIIIDECHRGSAAEDSAWREILDHFSSATHIGLTATPKETEYVSNIDYFGEPVYSYTLREGIDDGFLAPYKVIKCHIDRDVEGYRPEAGQVDRDGVEVEDRIYNTKDFDRVLVIDDRTKLVARRVTQFLKESGDRMQKTIVFCVDEEHAARMRQALINENQDLVAKESKYVMRITGSDKEGINQLANFIDPEAHCPVIVTTSRLLSTGVDAQTCRLIVLDRQIGSMTEFKQIVGRGTRVHSDTGKYYFTLMDFRGATSHFADPDFDGDPVQIYQPTGDDPMVPPEDGDDAIDIDNGNGADPNIDGIEILINPTDGDDTTAIDGSDNTGPIRKIYIDGVGATIIKERVEYLDADGKLITESLKDFTRKHLTRRFASMDDFLKRWNAEERKQAIIDELADEGLDLTMIGSELGQDLDPFDLVCHIAFDAKPLTRKERAENVKKRDVFNRYGEQARAVLDALLEKYADEGVFDLDDTNILQINPFSHMGTPIELMRAFGRKPDYLRAVHDLQNALYEESA
ncbi:EcoAI/FtnUII family type I restriction enzme subunit R [Paracoccus seriniphilus]|uniref:Type I restriction enzyme, R subunit n=1 Tax=Paracoccus seriniphilus TaxID=184748 RepID=A0A239Q4C9_9RHOB|nr:DEAD/DEAH box helicase family protein [Paracoccus seriniphilus]WCR16580.1 DEAD/DEAH box helicase family protein [Paracoccus seriniphilus]SNT76807.1 type I restriction enzyme, R subunit [Paracoccus seriniphilus]